MLFPIYSIRANVLSVGQVLQPYNCLCLLFIHPFRCGNETKKNWREKCFFLEWLSVSPNQIDSHHLTWGFSKSLFLLFSFFSHSRRFVIKEKQILHEEQHAGRKKEELTEFLFYLLADAVCTHFGIACRSLSLLGTVSIHKHAFRAHSLHSIATCSMICNCFVNMASEIRKAMQTA